MNDSNIFVTLNNVTVEYDKQEVLKDVNLTIKEGDFIGIIGPNGGGKTTLIKVILQTKKIYSGNIYFAPNINIGYLPQQNDIDKMFPISVEDIVLSGIIKANESIFTYVKTKKDIKDQMYDLLNKMNLYNIRKRAINTLSGGQMQKALLCRALISNPDILLLDEPNTYIDKESEFELYNYLVSDKSLKAILLVSHDIGTISAFIKSIACVNLNVYYHESNVITEEILHSYNCPIQLVAHGNIPHTVLKNH